MDNSGITPVMNLGPNAGYGDGWGMNGLGGIVGLLAVLGIIGGGLATGATAMTSAISRSMQRRTSFRTASTSTICRTRTVTS